MTNDLESKIVNLNAERRARAAVPLAPPRVCELTLRITEDVAVIDLVRALTSYGLSLSNRPDGSLLIHYRRDQRPPLGSYLAAERLADFLNCWDGLEAVFDQDRPTPQEAEAALEPKGER